MVRVCLFNSTRAWGGGEKWHLDTATYLHAKGIDVLLFAHEKGVLKKRAGQKDLQVESLDVSNLSFLNPFKLLRLKKQFAAMQVEVLVMNLSRDLKLAGLAAKLAGVRRIIYRRGSDIPIKNTPVNRWIFKNIPTDILANSEATKGSLLKNNPHLFPKNKIRVIYNGLNLAHFDSVKSRPSLAENQPLKLLNLGRLEKQKNQKFLLQLAKELKNREVNFELIIGGSGRLEKELKDMAATLDLTREVTFAGFIEDVKAFLSQGDIFLLSSHWEGFGYVLAEASLCELPVVAFQVSSNCEVVKQGETGILTPLGEVAAFADAVEKLYRTPALRQRMGQAGRKFVKENFNLQQNLAEVAHYLTDAG